MSPQDEVTLGEMHRTLERVEAKLDQKADKADVARVEAQAVKTNGRVTGLEAWKNKATGAWFAASLAGPILTAMLIDKLTH